MMWNYAFIDTSPMILTVWSFPVKMAILIKCNYNTCNTNFLSCLKIMKQCYVNVIIVYMLFCYTFVKAEILSFDYCLSVGIL